MFNPWNNFFFRDRSPGSFRNIALGAGLSICVWLFKKEKKEEKGWETSLDKAAFSCQVWPSHPHGEEKVKEGFGENVFARIHAFQKSKGIENSETQLHGYFTVLSNNVVSWIFRFLDHGLSHLHNKWFFASFFSTY